MSTIENRPENSTRRLTRRQKVALLGASLLGAGAGLFLADRGGDDPDPTPETTSTEVTQPDTTSTEVSISETPQSIQPTPVNTEPTISKNPTAMTPKPVETSSSDKG